MPKRSLHDWLQLLESRHPSEIELGLDRVNTVWRRLQSAHNFNQSPLAITVSGTNGKGSTLASMQALLLQHCHTVGMFTSPHFLAYNERICLAGQPVADEIIVQAFELIETQCQGISLTYFEFGTLAALVVFHQAMPEVMLLEVGLGGRLDAINIIDADVAVLTSVALDHQDWLGDTREAIAREKLGIARAGRPLIVGEQDHPPGFMQMIEDTGAKALLAGTDFSFTEGTSFTANMVGENGPLCFEHLNGRGLLPVNKTLALQALLAAGISLDGESSRAALESVGLTGRRQSMIFRGIEVILDVAHNPAAAEVLAASLEQIEANTVAVASVLDDKDWSGIVSAISSAIDQWNIAEISDSPRATKGQSLLELLYNAGQSGSLHQSVEEAFLNAVAECSTADRIIVFGSFHTVAAVLNLILAEVSSE